MELDEEEDEEVRENEDGDEDKDEEHYDSDYDDYNDCELELDSEAVIAEVRSETHMNQLGK